ncbi:response regulator [Hymenobacter sp. DG25A]|uniref:response regulator n=1 Tax=Hymenobacter sp. DG25A TaxID=1385663 RepID=UPI0006BC5983|nr:response regulator [Hymenobacter sp. DG25A]ALD22267.1 hypothetical protein AM218_14910 [Hymenobacter sp. DG25A]
MIGKVSLLILITKTMFSFFKNKEDKSKKTEAHLIDELAPLTEFSHEEFEKAKLKARIAFVDDEEVNYVNRLQKDGYNVAYWEDIENIDDFANKGYNVVVLDIQGIGKTISESSEGWGILKYLKNTYPHIVVIMYTGADWSITKFKNQADQADDFIGKDFDYLDFKYTLDTNIKKAFSNKYHLEINKRELMKVIKGTDSPDEIIQILQKYGKDKELAIKKVKEVTSNGEVIKTASAFLSLAKTIFDLAN